MEDLIMLRLLNIHGYIGNGEDSTSAAMLEELGVEVISPTINYDRHNADTIFSCLKDSYELNRCNGVIGCSLGGFFALQLSFYFDCPAILINPCVLPFKYLPICGYKGSLTAYTMLFGNLSRIDKRLICTLIGEKDPLIVPEDQTVAENVIGSRKRFWRDAEGRHRTSSLTNLTEFLKFAIGHSQAAIGGAGESFPTE
jgi:hypothetical protein